jgi:hypothetical protein
VDFLQYLEESNATTTAATANSSIRCMPELFYDGSPLSKYLKYNLNSIRRNMSISSISQSELYKISKMSELNSKSKLLKMKDYNLDVDLE